MSKITMKSYAKVNLSLDVTGVRDDGYHMLETVMQKISLYDEITVEWIPWDDGNIKIDLTSNKPFLPRDDKNIAYKAAQLMSELFRVRIGGGNIKIYLDKHIPVSAGLAGGSGNGAAVITALNKLWKLGVGTRRLCQIGESLGADVPFCVLTQNSRYGCALGEDTGARLTVIKSRFKKHMILVKPAFGVSTKEVYRGIDECVLDKRPDTKALTEAIMCGDKDTVYANMINVLEDYTLNRYEEVLLLKEKLQKETDAEKVLMTGSGPTVFALFSDIRQAKRTCRDMRKQGYEAYWAKTL